MALISGLLKNCGLIRQNTPLAKRLRQKFLAIKKSKKTPESVRAALRRLYKKIQKAKPKKKGKKKKSVLKKKAKISFKPKSKKRKKS